MLESRLWGVFKVVTLPAPGGARPALDLINQPIAGEARARLAWTGLRIASHRRLVAEEGSFQDDHVLHSEPVEIAAGADGGLVHIVEDRHAVCDGLIICGGRVDHAGGIREGGEQRNCDEEQAQRGVALAGGGLHVGGARLVFGVGAVGFHMKSGPMYVWWACATRLFAAGFDHKKKNNNSRDFERDLSARNQLPYFVFLLKSWLIFPVYLAKGDFSFEQTLTWASPSKLLTSTGCIIKRLR